MERDNHNQEKIEVEKQKLSKYTEEKNNQILGYNNQVRFIPNTPTQSLRHRVTHLLSHTVTESFSHSPTQ